MRPSPPPIRRRPRPPAFTLLEVLIAVAALAFVAVGVATIFEQTGRAVRAGRRVSTFNQYASLIERQMRTDLSAMTRDGFLVIRNEYAGGASIAAGSPPEPVPLAPGDLNPRPRRADQLMFFAKGGFTSAREPLSPGVTPRADAARIYYGHGQRALPPAAGETDGRFLFPQASDANRDDAGYDLAAERLGHEPAGGLRNPNRFASDWTLVRHLTLLAPPAAAPTRWPTTGDVYGFPFPNPLSAAPAAASPLNDSAVQVALQPAAHNVFRTLLPFYPRDPALNAPATDPLTIRSYLAEPTVPARPWPTFTSGVIDVATTDLSAIRQVVLTADVWPRDARTWATDARYAWPGRTVRVVGGNVAGGRFYNPLFQANAQALATDGYSDGPDGRWTVVPFPPGVGAASGGDAGLIERQQAWMDDAWPSDVNGANPADGGALTEPTQWTRVRVEPFPVNFLGSGEGLSASATDELVRAVRRADQFMLSAHAFLPRCTEFIVEWSFGKSFPTPDGVGNVPAGAIVVPGREGQLIWHGMERRTGPDQSLQSVIGLGSFSQASALRIPAAFPYLDAWGGAVNSPTNSALARLSQLAVPWQRRDGAWATRNPDEEQYPPGHPQAGTDVPDSAKAHRVWSRVVHGRDFFPQSNPVAPDPGRPITSYFGYADPTFFAEREPDGAGFDGRLNQPGDAASPTLPSAWPRLIRVTLSLADPADPAVEQTFQFVFDVPQPTP